MVASREPIVVDASIAFLWFANEPDRSGAARLLETESLLLSPDLMIAEVTNAWWKKLRRREMSLIDVEQAVTNLLALGIDWTPSAELVRPAARLATELEHSVYDLRRAAARMGIPVWPSRPA
jgi:predicted nucleic acid-binding protein